MRTESGLAASTAGPIREVTMRSMLVPLFLILGASSFVACASTPDQKQTSSKIEANGDRYVNIEAGKKVELNLDVPQSAAPISPVIVTFAASAPISWNLLSTAWGNSEMVVQGESKAHVIQHTPHEAAKLSLYWENHSASPIRATIRVKGLPAGTTAVWNDAQ